LAGPAARNVGSCATRLLPRRARSATAAARRVGKPQRKTVAGGPPRWYGRRLERTGAPAPARRLPPQRPAAQLPRSALDSVHYPLLGVSRGLSRWLPLASRRCSLSPFRIAKE